MDILQAPKKAQGNFFYYLGEGELKSSTQDMLNSSPVFPGVFPQLTIHVTVIAYHFW